MSSQYQNCTSITPTCPIEATIYGYYPNLAGNAFFVAAFAILSVLNIVLGLGLRQRTCTYMVAMTCGCVGESVGYIGRILLHGDPWGNSGFEIQICLLIVSPAFFSGAIYLTLKHIVLCFGPEYSRIKPNHYTSIFITCDIFTLVIQGAGGGIAASANTNSLQKVGKDMMMAGIALQVVILLAFATAGTDYLLRLRRSTKPLSAESQAVKADKRFQLFIGGLLFAFTTIFTRCCYRIAEMAGGWSNPIMQDETAFMILDGAMVLIAGICLTVLHPGYCFPRMGNSQYKAAADQNDAEELKGGSM